MNVLINKSKAKGTVAAPPSKSMAHRLLICSYLALGGNVSGIEYSEDIKATLACIKALEDKTDLYCNESGSTLRFFIPICLLSDREITISGAKRLFERDLSVYEKICKEQGLLFEKKESSVTLRGRLRPGVFKLRGDISSQFISGLLFALPLLEADSEIKLETPLESRPYIDLTLKALSDFGIDIEVTEHGFKVKGNRKYRPIDTQVEGDYSNAAFFDGFNCIGADVTVTNLDKNSLQGDRVYKEYFERIKQSRPTLDVTDCPDLAPILMALAAANNGCTLVGTKRLKIKESDRGAAMAAELAKFGVCVETGDNEITVGCGIKAPTANLCGHNDHRIVMSLAVLCTLTGGVIEGAQAVSKSLPDFFDRIKKLGIEVKEYEA